MPPVARATLLVVAVLAAASLVFAAGDRRGADPLAEAIERGGDYVRTSHDSSDTWQQVRDASGPMYARAARALKDGRRMLALQRLAAARLNVAAYAYVSAQPEHALTDTTGLAAWWVREGDSLATFLGRTPPSRRRGRDGEDPAAIVATLHPAAIRAVAETALPQIRNYYDAALTYGYATQPQFGFFYVGVARAQREMFALCRDLSQPAAKPEPAFRSIAAELDTLHAHVLAAYRPPLSIDRHPEFIGVSSAIKEARELDAAGLRRGALLRYLVAAQRFAAFHPAAASPDSATLAQRLAAFEARVAAAPEDHSIADVLLESAHSEIETTKPGEVSPVAAAVVDEVMPLYFAALAPAPPVAALAKKPEATVTLVRWPYT